MKYFVSNLALITLLWDPGQVFYKFR